MANGDRCRPYFAIDPSWWPLIVELLPLPFPLEVVLADLRFLENEGRRGHEFPSLADLRRRWGWSRRQVDKVLAGELGDWHDDLHPMPLDALRLVDRAPNRLGLSTQAIKQAVTLKTVQPGVSGESGHATEHASDQASAGESADNADLDPYNQYNHGDHIEDPTDLHLSGKPDGEVIDLEVLKETVQQVRRRHARLHGHGHQTGER